MARLSKITKNTFVGGGGGGGGVDDFAAKGVVKVRSLKKHRKFLKGQMNQNFEFSFF